MPLNTRRTRYDDAAGENSETVPNVNSTGPDDSLPTMAPALEEPQSISMRARGDTNKKKKHKKPSQKTGESISCIGEIPANEAMAFAENISAVSDALTFDLENYPHIELLSRMKETLESIQEQLEEINGLREEIQDPTAMIISFSALTWPKLTTRLGLKPPLANQIDQDCLKSILDRTAQTYLESSDSEKKIYDPKAWNHNAVLNHLQLIDELVLQRKEASARISIDRWVLELGQHLKTESFWVLIIPELTILDARDKKAMHFTTITYNNLNTVFTGVADYALFTQSEDDWRKVDFKAFKQGAWEGSSLMDLTFYLKDVNIVVVEAKDIQVKKLEAHIPQVVGQCIAIMRSDSTHQRHAVPFYLTNGKSWIFGIVKECLPNRSLECFILPTFNVSTGDIVDPLAGDSAAASKYESFLRILITWAKADPLQIVDAIVAALGTAKGESI